MTTMFPMTSRPTRRLRGVCAQLLLALLLLTWTTMTGALPAAATTTAADAGTEYGRMMLVLDSSGSMKEPAGGGQSKIEAARTALGDVVDSLPEQADVGLRVFGAKVFSRKDKGACTDSQQVVAPGTDNRDDLRKAVAAYKPYGETPIGYALRQAADDIGSEGSRSIVLVSDGIATCQPDPCKVAAEIAERGIDLKVDVVGLGVDGKARNQLRCIAASGNGRYYDADSAAEIAESLVKVSDRAVRPFKFDGKPVQGGDTADSATALTAGVWTDVIGPVDSDTDERWYRYERTMKGSTLLVGTTLLGHDGGDRDSIALEVQTPEGDSCNLAAGGSVGVRFELFGIGTRVGGGEGVEPEDPCLAGPLLIKIDRSNDIGRERPSRYSLRVAEEPAVEDAGNLPGGLAYDDGTYRAPQVSGSGTPVEGGDSLGDATELENGRYRGRIVPGEIQVFKMKVGWGQQLSARVRTEVADAALVRAGLQQTPATLDLFNPLGAQVPDDLEGAETYGALAPRAATTQSVSTLPVRWQNHEGTSTTYVAGWYYVAYAAAPDREDDSAELPFTLDVEVQGDEAGVPSYADGAKLLTDSTQAEVDDEGDSSGTASKSDGKPSKKAEKSATKPDSGDKDSISSTVKLAAAGGLGLVALACAAVGVLLIVKRPGR